MPQISKEVDARTDNFLTLLRRRKIKGTFQSAKETLDLLRFIVAHAKFHTVTDLLDILRSTEKRLQEAVPLAFAVVNSVLRVMLIARMEICNMKLKEKSVELYRPALRNLVVDVDLQDLCEPLGDKTRELRTAIISSITEMMDEFGNMYQNISAHSTEHIHANEVIMTFGSSRTVEKFLLSAAKKRDFEVIVAEAAPLYSGQETTLVLAEQQNIRTTLISDSSVFAMMARVNKVIVGTHAVMANGGLMAQSGMYAVAAAAKMHSVPMVVCTGMYKLCPIFPNDRDALSGLQSPNSILSFEEVTRPELLDAVNPEFDYIPPEFISLYITNDGRHNPTYIYRLLQELYCPEDSIRSEKEH